MVPTPPNQPGGPGGEVTAIISVIEALIERGDGAGALSELAGLAPDQLLQPGIATLYGEALWLCRDFEGLAAHIQRLQQSDDGGIQASATATLFSSRLAHRDGNYLESLQDLSPLLTGNAVSSLDRGLAARLHQQAGKAWVRLRDFDQAREHFRRALIGFEAQGSTIETARTLDLLALVERTDLAFDRADAYHSKSLELSLQVGATALATVCSLNLSALRIFRGQFLGADALLRRAAGLAEEIDDLPRIARAVRLRVLFLVRCGLSRTARLTALNALKATQRAKNRRGLAIVCEYIGEFRLAQGQLDRARRWLKRGYQRAFVIPERDIMGETRRLLAEIELQTGNIEQAIAIAEETLAAFEKMEDRYEVAVSRRVLGAALLRAGRNAEAIEHLTRAIEFFEKMSERFEIYRAQALLAVARDEFDGESDAILQSGGRAYDEQGALLRAEAERAAGEVSPEAEDAADEDSVANGDASSTPAIPPSRKRARLTGRVLIFGEKTSPALQQAINQGFPGLIGNSDELVRALNRVRKIARTDDTVLVQGETGTGKELIAHALHTLSSRAKLRFVAVNCGALASDLLDAEIFGHRRGAFTGAIDERAGLARTASGGSLFLDEIAELPAASQPRLLRLLDTGEVRSVGSDIPIRVDVRVIAATHQPLDRCVRDGLFRRDLYHRLTAHTIALPPLRERIDDLPILIEHFARELRASGRPFAGISTAVLRRMSEYEWPGNVRELRNTVAMLATRLSSDYIANEWEPPRSEDALRRSSEIDKDEVARALRLCNGNVEAAAFNLGLTKQRLYRLCEKFGVDFRAFRKT